MFLREFLYVDSDKVRGLLAQLDEGIVEASTETGQSEKVTGGGVKGFAEHSQRWGTATSTQKSQGDALFPMLEGALETEGMLTDLSELLSQPAGWEDLGEDFPPGSLVRMTADGSMLDARYLASTLAAFSTAAGGLKDVTGPQEVLPAPGQRGRQTPKKQASKRPPVREAPLHIEDTIPDEPVDFGDGPVLQAAYLRGIVRVARALFTPGLHLNLRPTGDPSYAVTARLQEGRQFLDSDPEILFSRYGVSPQKWTLVGSVGFYAVADTVDVQVDGFMTPDGSLDRARFADVMNGTMLQAAQTGFVDAPQAPGFSVVPLAVYRGIGSPAAVSQSLETIRGT